MNDTTSGEGLARVTYLPGVQPPEAVPSGAGPSAGGPSGAGASEAVPSEALPAPARSDSDPAAGWAPPLAFSPPIPVAGRSAVAGTQRAGTQKAGTQKADIQKAGVQKAGVQKVDTQKVDTQKADTQKARAENVSMHALTRRGMSRWELERTLRSRELEDELVAEELERLERVGLIDDASLAETIVRTQHERKGLGRSALTAELRRRHIGQEHIDAALEQVGDDDEQARATELALKRAPQLRSYDRETAQRRLSGFLMRKGYGGSVVRTAVDAALSDHGSSGSGVRFR